MEPFFITQSFETPERPFTDESRREWIEAQIVKARGEGAVFARVSITDQGEGLLFEAWSERPQDQGEPRWSLVEEGQVCDHKE